MIRNENRYQSVLMLKLQVEDESKGFESLHQNYFSGLLSQGGGVELHERYSLGTYPRLYLN